LRSRPSALDGAGALSRSNTQRREVNRQGNLARAMLGSMARTTAIQRRWSTALRRLWSARR